LSVRQVRNLIIQGHLRLGERERRSVRLARPMRSQGSDASALTFRPAGHSVGALVTMDLTPASLQTLDTGLNLYVPGLHRAIHERAA
jgi:hypothetical protein